MNAHIAGLLLTRIVGADLPWLDKYAGLVRPITFKEGKKSVTMPVACNVEDPLSCDPGTTLELLPDQNYASVLFIEGDAMPARTSDRRFGVQYTSRLRVVVWMNCEKLGGGCDCGSLSSINLTTAILGNHRQSYSTELFRDIRHTVVGGTTRGKDVFGAYTLNEERTQYLHYPFDAFAVEVETTFRLMPGCEESTVLNDVSCWTAPANNRRQHPKDFTCEQLQDPTNGLTAEQLGVDCLNCAGDATCDPIEIEVNGVVTELLDNPCGGTAVIEVQDQDGNQVGEQFGSSGTVWRVNTGGDVECEDATYQLKDSVGTNIGSAGTIASGGSANITAPDGTVTIKNLNGDTLGTQDVPSNGAEDYIAPIPLKFGWGAGNADTLTWTVTADEAGTYGTYTNDGGSGTITYSKNGGGFASVTGSITLAVSDTIVVRRTITTNAGYSRWVP